MFPSQLVALYGPKSFNPLSIPGLAAWYSMYDTGDRIVQTGVALLGDKSGNSSANVLALNGVSGNEATTPSAANNRITGDHTMRCRVMAVNYASGANQFLIAKSGNGGARCYDLALTNAGGGNLTARYTRDGSTILTAASSVNLSVLSALTTYWLAATRRSSDGNVKLYYAADNGSNTPPSWPGGWTQLGTDLATTAGALFDSATQVVEYGAELNASAFNGNILYADLMNGYNGAGSVVQQFTPATASKLATSFVSASGETYTIATTGDQGARICGARDLVNLTAAHQPTLSAGGALFNGTSQFLQSAQFALIQPEFVMFLGRQVAWSSGRIVLDGVGTNSMSIQQYSASPRVTGSSDVQELFGWTIGSDGIVSFGVNGANGTAQLNRNAALTSANWTANNANGFTLAASGGGGAYSNVLAKEILLFSAIPAAGQITQLINYLSRRWALGI